MTKLRRTSLALALLVASAGAAGAQSPAPPAPEAPVSAEQAAPKGSSGGDIALGAAAGIVGGLLILALILGTD